MAVPPQELDLVHTQPHLSRRDWLHHLGGLTSVAVTFAMTVKYMKILPRPAVEHHEWTEGPATLFDRRRVQERLRQCPNGLYNPTHRRTTRRDGEIEQLAICHRGTAQSNNSTYCPFVYANNGAAYMEAMLRNTDLAAWNAMWGLKFQIAYGSALQSSARGVVWLQQTTTMMLVTLDQEIRTGHNIAQYLIPWNNRVVGGFDNAIEARGQVPLRPLGSGMIWDMLWTSMRASYETFPTHLRCSMRRLTQRCYHTTPISILFHDTIGPFASVDLMYVLPPQSLVVLYDTMYLSLLRTLQSNDQMNRLYQSTATTTTFDMVPPNWIGSDVVYSGGNPFYYGAGSQTFIQQSFGFDDA
ncbi:Aste57867_25449 [Aphanomyces stellatus]|uniref:Aste57867_25449 protein n=1 Tax=Aphanomyces stellatus TaxID=120398 RepID=A0A485LT41_9STRA|nr:hypothetical protein As57867_025370 [Aphanomyces stellatus]VFU02072.1 Aste57867_25449 [Aphanomyces stellatus]